MKKVLIILILVTAAFFVSYILWPRGIFAERNGEIVGSFVNDVIILDTSKLTEEDAHGVLHELYGHWKSKGD